MFPIGDAPNPRGVPVITYLLIAINVAVYLLVTVPLEGVRPAPGDPVLAQYVGMLTHELGGQVPAAALASHVSMYDLFVFVHGFRPGAPSLASLVVSMFLHAGLAHLAGNMLFLWIYGDNVERYLGGLRYLLWYLGTGAAATAFHAAGSPGSLVPLIGASGAISGILGCYFVWFPRNVVRLLWLLPPFIGQVVEVPARIVLGLYLLMDNLLPYLLVRDQVGVAHGAHIGGFLAGAGLAWWVQRRGVVAHPDLKGVAAEPGSIGAAIDAGRFAEAASAYFALPARATRGVLGPEHALALAAWLRRGGHADAALALLRRAARDVPGGPSRAAVHLELGRILLEDLAQPALAYQHFLTVLDHDAGSDLEAAARAGIAAIAARQKRQIGRAR